MANRRGEEVTDEQWELIGPLIPDPPRRADGRGRPWRDKREIMNGVLWILRSGARWQDLPERFPPYQTCHRRYQQWVRSGVLRDVLETLAQDLHERGELDLSEVSLMALSSWRKKGALRGENQAGQRHEAHGGRPLGRSDSSGFPLALHVTSASPNEVTLVTNTLEQRFIDGQPERLIGDKAYDSDGLDAELAQQGVKMIAPHRRNRKKAATQDGRTLRRYKRRWKIERLFAWLHNYRRVLTRFDYYPENYLGFVHLACIKILLNCYL